MNPLLQKKVATLLSTISFFMLFVFFISCKKDMNTNNTDTPAVQENKPDLTTKITSSVSGFVTNHDDAPVVGAEVKAGGTIAITDRYGYFEIKNIQVVKEAATVTVSYNGYFKAIKTYMATEGKAAFFRIKLLPKTIAGTITANAGGNVSLSNGLNISFPANAIKDASSGVAYNGTVNVAAQYIDPTSAELNSIMPGDLRGINTDGNIKGLTSFGMMAVELLGASGELLQIADGKKATLTMPVPNAALASAPATIPLWYFDESNGLWKEEGVATKTGNGYVGDVSHFTYWNCDLPNATVPLSFTVVDVNGNPVTNANVEILPTTPGSFSHISGYTDYSGYVSVFVTANNSYSLNILGNCNNMSVYSQSFSVTTTPVALGNIVIGSTSAATAIVSGTITDCSDHAVTNGNLIIQNGNYYFKYPVDNTGAYQFSIILCSATNNVNLIAEDITGSQQSPAMPYTLVAGTNNIGNMQACGINNEEFVSYSINGGPITRYTVSEAVIHSFFSSSYYIEAYPTDNSDEILFNFDTTGIGLGSIHPLLSVYEFHISISGNPPPTENVYITEYGPSISGFIAGHFTTTMTDGNSGATYVLATNFRVRRIF